MTPAELVVSLMWDHRTDLSQVRLLFDAPMGVTDGRRTAGLACPFSITSQKTDGPWEWSAYGRSRRFDMARIAYNYRYDVCALDIRDLAPLDY